ncbi:MAG: zinc ribbon domain-containing protein [Rhizobacter sp.]
MHTKSGPGRYCTRCGTFNQSEHSFCDHCGFPLLRRAAAQTHGAAEPGKVTAAQGDGPLLQQHTSSVQVSKQLRWLAPGAALCCVLVAALASVIWHAAAPPPSSQQVLETLRLAGAPITKPSPDLLCLNNLPYHRNHIQIQPTDTTTRTWLDGLVSAGLYEPGVEVVPDDMTGSTLIQYQSLPALNEWRRDGKLCVAQGWEVQSVQDNSIQRTAQAQRKRYVASLSWRAHTVAPWLAQLPPLDSRMTGVNVDANGLTTYTRQTLERVNGRWLAVEQ